ncbi:MAG: lysophospholipid acyltransferase family protein [Betaproteobacteria bacterium]|nr:lysophospholipid acyltransferase family protein [Betaproteobacteria bacterium]
MIDIVPASYARRGGTITMALGRTLLRWSGWRFEGSLPDVPKLVIAVAPHTTNWDFVIGVLALWAMDVKISFLGKHTLFRGWFGRWMRSIGGIPVDRTQSHGVVGETVAAFNRVDRMVLAIAPEGTRQLDKGFKKGFLYIAHAAKAPVLLAYFDFSRKVVGFGPLLVPSNDVESDMKQVLDFYRPIRGKYRKVWQEAPQ